ncbi:MAG: DUF1501 domain-containing protein [Acidobacteriaceae bacterium]|nr:DUF1501 domain-containing protein [Acidobacteriaceae bacterium]
MRDRFGNDWSRVRGTQFWKRPHVSRRVFFRHAAAAIGGYYLLPTRPMQTIAKAAAAPIGTAKNCIFILLTGAPSHIDTFDLKEGAWTPSYFNPTTYGDVRFPQGLMPNIASHLGSIALARSVRAWAVAHGLAQTWVQIGRNPTSGLSKIAPHIGSVVAMELGPSSSDHTLPAFVSLNTGSGPDQGYFPPDDAPFYVSPGGSGLGNTTHAGGQDVFNRRYQLKLTLDADLDTNAPLGDATAQAFDDNQSARKLMYNSAVDSIFNFDSATKASYGSSSFGNACVVARNLVRANLGTRFVQISFGSWDHHVNIYAPNTNLQLMSKQFDAGLGQLITDLKSDGTLDSTLIVALGEFGRTTGALNTNAGRDHLPQQTALFAGAKVTGGKVIGSTDATGSNIADPGWSRQREIRPEDLEATIYSALGIDWTKVRHDDPFNRGFEYVPFSEQDLYGPVNELWS